MRAQLRVDPGEAFEAVEHFQVIVCGPAPLCFRRSSGDIPASRHSGNDALVML